MTTEITRDEIVLPRRERCAHKGDFGKVLLICGSEKYTGAAFFSAQAAVNAGIITSLIGQGIPPLRAAYTGVWLHGAAGDLAANIP